MRWQLSILFLKPPITQLLKVYFWNLFYFNELLMMFLIVSIKSSLLSRPIIVSFKNERTKIFLSKILARRSENLIRLSLTKLLFPLKLKRKKYSWLKFWQDAVKTWQFDYHQLKLNLFQTTYFLLGAELLAGIFPVFSSLKTPIGNMHVHLVRM